MHQYAISPRFKAKQSVASTTMVGDSNMKITIAYYLSIDAQNRKECVQQRNSFLQRIGKLHMLIFLYFSLIQAQQLAQAQTKRSRRRCISPASAHCVNKHSIPFNSFFRIAILLDSKSKQPVASTTAIGNAATKITIVHQHLLGKIAHRRNEIRMFLAEKLGPAVDKDLH